jgi:choline-sulfatase
MFKGTDLCPILERPSASVQEALHFTYEDDIFPVKGADCIRAIVERGWKYAVYYDPFTGMPAEYELYDLTSDPLEMRNLAHSKYYTAAHEAARLRLHGRLTAMMHEKGTLPDEIRWPTAAEFQPAMQAAVAEE